MAQHQEALRQSADQRPYLVIGMPLALVFANGLSQTLGKPFVSAIARGELAPQAVVSIFGLIAAGFWLTIGSWAIGKKNPNTLTWTVVSFGAFFFLLLAQFVALYGSNQTAAMQSIEQLLD